MEDKIKDANWVIIDAMNLAYRSWHSVKALTTGSGQPSGLEFGMTRALLYLARNWYPAKLVLVWDGLPVQGTEIHGEYKAGRDHSEQHKEKFFERCAALRELYSDIITTYYDPAKEADYVIAEIVAKLPGVKVILSSDDDYLGLVDFPGETNILVVKPGTRGTTDRLMDNAAVKERMGVEPARVALYRAFDGDSSDNLPGVVRVPATLKVKAVEQVDLTLPVEKQLDQVVMNARRIHPVHGAKYAAHREQAEKNYQISDLRGRRHLPQKWQPIARGEASRCIAMCKELEMTSLIERKEWQLFKGNGRYSINGVLYEEDKVVTVPG